jgi:hypothetical protein
MNKLSYWNYTCLRHFVCLFCYISSNSTVNKMDANSISVCVAPSLFHKLDRPNDLETSYQLIHFVRLLIENCASIFGEDTLDLLEATKSRTTTTTTTVVATTTPTTDHADTINDMNMISSFDSLKIHELDTDSIEGHNIDSSVDDVIGTSSEIDGLDGVNNLHDYIKSRNQMKNENSASTAIHDFSSNTLSVDSGLSVPTATSDPESEKSIENAVLMAKLHDRHAELTSNFNKEVSLRRQKKLSSNTRTLSLRDDTDQTVTNGSNSNNGCLPTVDDINNDEFLNNHGGAIVENRDTSHNNYNYSTTITIPTAGVQTKMYMKSDANKRTSANTTNKYQKRVSTIMKQFSESDICCDQTPSTSCPSSTNDGYHAENISLMRHTYTSHNDDNDHQLIQKPDTDLSTNLKRKESQSTYTKSLSQVPVTCKSTVSLRAFSLNDDLKNDNLQAHSTPTKPTSQTIPISNKKSMIKINFEKSLSNFQTSIVKGRYRRQNQI